MLASHHTGLLCGPRKSHGWSGCWSCSPLSQAIPTPEKAPVPASQARSRPSSWCLCRPVLPVFRLCLPPAGLKAASRRCPRLSSTCDSWETFLSLRVSGLSSGAEVRPWSHVLFLLGSRFCSALGLGWPCPAGSGYVGDLVVTFLLFPAHCRGSAVFRPEQDRLSASLCRGVAGSQVGGVRRPHQPPGASSSASGVCCSSDTLAFHFPSLFVLPLTVTRAVSL